MDIVSTVQISRADAAARTGRVIIASARDALALNGPDGLSMQQVADDAGISRPGLLKHFASKARLIDAVARSFAEDATAAMAESDELTVAATAVAERVPNATPLSTMLLAEALTRPREDREAVTLHHRALVERFGTDDRALADVAALEALQVMASYVTGLDPLAMLERRHRGASQPIGVRSPRPDALELAAVLTDRPGYASGRRRRQRIIDDASALFAEQGFHGTTMRDVAARVDVAPSTLLHHFADKAELLAEVLRLRDVEMVQRRADEVLEPEIELRALGDEAALDQVRGDGLISLYSILSTEAILEGHPAHDYFRQRYARTIAYFENLFARASEDLNIEIDSAFEAIWLVALWDGLQFMRLLVEPDVDIPGRLRRHISQVLDATTLADG